MAPIKIDGTDITGATIDGTDVTEITVDGDTVFSAFTPPVAYSNLVAWYPFDSATYGGSNADDVTAILGGSGDDTAYDGTVNGPTYQSSDGVTDINAGANSGAFNFDGNNDFIDTIFSEFLSDFTIMAWFNVDDTSRCTVLGNETSGVGNGIIFGANSGFLEFDNYAFYGNFDSASYSTNTWTHIALTSETKAYKNANTIGTKSSSSLPNPKNMLIGDFYGEPSFFNGRIDDVRIYDTALSSTQISQIYQNTQP